MTIHEWIASKAAWIDGYAQPSVTLGDAQDAITMQHCQSMLSYPDEADREYARAKLDALKKKHNIN